MSKNNWDKLLSDAMYCLEQHKTLLYPTDTVWGLGCDATNYKAVSKIFEIKKREDSKSLVILVDGLTMLKNVINEIPTKAIELLKTQQEKSTTIIYKNPKGLAKNVLANDNSVAIRIVQDEFCKQLISKFGQPIVSTSANISGKGSPTCFKEIDKSILEAVDYIVNLHPEKIMSQPSRIIRILGSGDLEIIRD